MDAAGQDVTVEQVAQAQDGDQDAFARMVAAHHRDVIRVCFLVGGSLDMAEDSAQATWVQVWRRLKTLRDPTHLRAWILAIAANEARQQVRRERIRRLLPPRSSEASVE
jgi:RNA polymerase sigma-70 factor, ECF subfamily